MFKTCTFTLMHICIAFAVAYLLSGSIMVGGAIALIEPLCNSVGYFFHEKVWARIHANRSLSLGGAQPSSS